MTALDLDALQALADEARQYASEATWYDVDYLSGVLWPPMFRDIASFIAAFPPEVAVALIERVRAERKTIEELIHHRDSLRARLEAAEKERDALRDGITRLADEWEALDMGTGLYPEDSAHRHAHEARAQSCADELRALLSHPDKEGGE